MQVQHCTIALPCYIALSVIFDYNLLLTLNLSLYLVYCYDLMKESALWKVCSFMRINLRLSDIDGGELQGLHNNFRRELSRRLH